MQILLQSVRLAKFGYNGSRIYESKQISKDTARATNPPGKFLGWHRRGCVCGSDNSFRRASARRRVAIRALLSGVPSGPVTLVRPFRASVCDMPPLHGDISGPVSDFVAAIRIQHPAGPAAASQVMGVRRNRAAGARCFRAAHRIVQQYSGQPFRYRFTFWHDAFLSARACDGRFHP